MSRQCESEDLLRSVLGSVHLFRDPQSLWPSLFHSQDAFGVDHDLAGLDVGLCFSQKLFLGNKPRHLVGLARHGYCDVDGHGCARGMYPAQGRCSERHAAAQTHCARARAGLPQWRRGTLAQTFWKNGAIERKTKGTP
jgi:hypothetical protein